jgi:hypothetical protein
LGLSLCVASISPMSVTTALAPGDRVKLLSHSYGCPKCRFMVVVVDSITRYGTLVQCDNPECGVRWLPRRHEIPSAVGQG